ncbi:phosphoribosyltransferase family protein [Halospeciosus flavus]|uniref:Phosphoribosyltransferase family protein n=1 Tax=Halospeciosus flavus TaxID=3032283 RepID=A0ABD5Z6K2_9EURY|nr:phosphoribosyltransferase family protein [Halospeciosus flavus]
MEWEDYRDVIQSAEYRYNVPALFAHPEAFHAFLDDLAEPFSPDEVDKVAGIDALGFVPGACLARELDAGFVAVRKGGKLPIAEEYRISEDLVDYTGEEKTLELDVRMVEAGCRVVVVDDWIETASQMTAAINLLERAGAEIKGIAVLGAEENETPLRLEEKYGVHSVRPWHEMGEPEREQRDSERTE